MIITEPQSGTLPHEYDVKSSNSKDRPERELNADVIMHQGSNINIVVDQSGFQTNNSQEDIITLMKIANNDDLDIL